jgi:hypothetical protein
VALKTIDMRKLTPCDETEATTKITDEDGSVYWYKSLKEQPKKSFVTYETMEEYEWYPAVSIRSERATNEQYIAIIEWWYECARKSPSYGKSLEKLYGNSDKFSSEMRKAYAWLVSNPQNRKKNLSLFINGWLGRNSI